MNNGGNSKKEDYLIIFLRCLSGMVNEQDFLTLEIT